LTCLPSGVKLKPNQAVHPIWLVELSYQCAGGVAVKPRSPHVSAAHRHDVAVHVHVPGTGTVIHWDGSDMGAFQREFLDVVTGRIRHGNRVVGSRPNDPHVAAVHGQLVGSPPIALPSGEMANPLLPTPSPMFRVAVSSTDPLAPARNSANSPCESPSSNGGAASGMDHTQPGDRNMQRSMSGKSSTINVGNCFSLGSSEREAK